MSAALKSPLAETMSDTSFHRQEKILLVDDDPGIRQLLNRLLTEEGYIVLTAGNGIEALQMSAATSFDLVLLDLNMPVMDGWETFEKISANNPLLPFIVITARPNQLFPALASGTGALMEKPLDLPKLFNTIKTLLKETPDVQLARVTGRPAEFFYVPPKNDDETKNDK